jgi:hypothetical protein
MRITWHYENGYKTQQFFRGGLSLTTIVVDYVQVTNPDTGASHRFESSKHRLTRRGVVLWESGTAELHKIGLILGVTLEGIRGFDKIELSRVPGGIRAELPSNKTSIMIPNDGEIYRERTGEAKPLAHRFTAWVCGPGWDWVCDLM